MPVPVFVDEIFCRHFAERSEPLRTPWSHPDEVSCGPRIPRISKPVNSATLKHDEPVLHQVHFNHAQRSARLVEHCVYCEVKTRLIGKQTLDLQAGIVSERMRGDRIFIRNDQTWSRDRFESLIGLLDDDDAARLRSQHSMPQSFRQIGVAAL